ncbi:MAG: hypothetical protein C0173_05950 [Desulfurella sp.]|nr:MAG: hypothetical protein C0173_05950 [Desulfurella sp.]
MTCKKASAYAWTTALERNAPAKADKAVFMWDWGKRFKRLLFWIEAVTPISLNIESKGSEILNRISNYLCF